MRKFITKHKLGLKILAFFLFLFFGGYIALFPARAKTVEIILKVVLGPTFKSEQIDFPKLGVIEIKNLELISKGQEIVFSPKTEIIYSIESLKKGRIEEIITYSPTLNIQLSDVSNVNIVSAFTSSSSKDESDKGKENKKKEKGSAVPIDKISTLNATINYSDISYYTPIHETVYDVNGYVSFNKEKGIELSYEGHKGDSTYSYSFTDYTKDYSMRILLKNVALNASLLQYAYNSPDITDVSGIANLDMTLASDGFFGGGNFENVSARYVDLADEITNINGTVEFLGEAVNVDATYDTLGKKNNIFEVRYAKETGVEVNMMMKDLPFTEAEKYKYLKEAGLPFQDMMINDVKISLIYNNLKEFIAKVAFDSKEFEYLGVKFEDTNGVLIFKDSILSINDLKTDLVFNINGKRIVDRSNLDIQINTKESKGDIKYNIQQLESTVPPIVGNFEFSFGEDFIFKNSSNILNISGSYSKEKKDLMLKIGDNEKNGLEIGYNFDENRLIRLSGEEKYATDSYILETKILDNKEQISIKTLSFKNSDLLINLQGDIDLKNSVYDVDFLVKNMDLALPSQGETFEISGGIRGKVKGENDIFKLNLYPENLNVNYYGKFENITGNIEIDRGEGLDLKFLGKIGKFTYGELVIDEINYDGTFINDILNIKQLQGSNFSLNGIYDLKNESGNLDINQVILPINKGKLPLKGNINYRNNLVILNKFYAGESLIEGQYDVQNGEYKLNAKIFERNLFKYLGTDEANGVLSGDINVKGKEKSIDLQTNLKLVNNFSNGRELPRLYFKGKYQAEDLTQGVFNMEKIEIDNLENQKLISMNGKYDVKNNYLEIVLPQQALDLYRIKHFIGGTAVEGKLHLAGKLSGKLDELTYYLNLNKGIIVLDEIRLGGLQGNVSGNLEKLELRNFRANYLNNSMSAKGDVNLKSGDYLINLKSNEIDLGFLNVFLKKYKLQDIKGDSVFNINLSNKGNKGYLKVKDFSMLSNDYLLTLENVNSVVNLDDKRVKIQSLQGKLNEGDVSLKGYIDIPESTDIEDSLELKSLNYEFQLNLKDIQYGYQKYFKLFVSSDLFLKDEILRGTVTIDKGIVNDIPAIQINIFKMIYDFLFKRDKNEDIRKSLGKNYEPTHSYEKDMKLDIYFKIKDGIKLDIPYVTAFVEDLKGEVFGQGNFIGEGGEMLFLGNVEVINSSFELNGTSFNVERGIVIFDKKKDYFPDLNPTISFTAKSKSWKNPLTLSLNGNLKDLNLSTGTSRWGEDPDASNLTSLFGGGNGEESNQAEASAFLLKGVIDSQASLVLKPISKLVKDTFNIQKFKIVSDVTTNENANQGTSDYFGFGAYIEAEDSIYKDKLYWVAKVNLISQTQSETNVRDDKTAGAVDKYDFSIIYKINSGFSVGVGIEKLSDDLVKKSSEKSGGNINYHIDFLFEKRYDSLMNIFRGN